MAIVTVNSDDPPLFNTTLTGELLLLHSAFGVDIAAIDDILLAAVRHSFLAPEHKQRVEAEFWAELAALKTLFLHCTLFNSSRQTQQSNWQPRSKQVVDKCSWLPNLPFV